MRANEFISEARKIGKMSKRQKTSMRGAEKFRDPGGYDRTYELNRVMMAVAGADGVNPIDINAESWSGKFNTSHPYTDVEHKMMIQALKALGSDYEDLVDGDQRSQELEIVNKVSPVKGFKGYKK